MNISGFVDLSSMNGGLISKFAVIIAMHTFGRSMLPIHLKQRRDHILRSTQSSISEAKHSRMNVSMTDMMRNLFPFAGQSDEKSITSAS